jgi:ribosomal protein S12 methylthiotransferase
MKTGRMLTTGGHYAFLKIAEGCEKHCTYCIIPSLRGKYRSVPMEELVAEAQSLADQGVKELILVAQETTLYGVDLYGKKMLPELLHRLAQIDGIYWIRIQYCYPEEITDELIETIETEEKVCHYLDIPIQHGSDNILRRMARRTTQAQLREIIGKLRERIPDIALRTTLITGFPGETEEDHEELMAFVDDMEFERLGVFTYSAEEDTPAATYPDQVPEELKEQRRDEVMELQQEIAFEKSENMVGRILDVMIEGKVADESAYVGRTYMDAPNVDGYIFVNSGELFMSGDFVRVKVTGASEYDLIGEVYDESAE